MRTSDLVSKVYNLEKMKVYYITFYKNNESKSVS